MPKSWEQMEGESDVSYARFVAFLGLGPARTIVRAYRLTHPDSLAEEVSGRWSSEAHKYEWRRRATDHDLSLFRDLARETAASYMASIRHFGEKALAAMASELPEMRPRTWAEALGAFAHLQAMFPADVIAGLSAGAATQGDPAGAPADEADVVQDDVPEDAFPRETWTEAARPDAPPG